MLLVCITISHIYDITRCFRGSLHHRRSIAASLVQGVYTLERDRQGNRHGPEALAPPWWMFFHFQLIRVLVDEVDNSIFGAIYELNASELHGTRSTRNAPRYVVAFRGTIPFAVDSILRDLKLNILCFKNELAQDSRFHIAMQAVHSTVAEVGMENVWLTGHSLGSAIALLVGRHMAKIRYRIESSYLFNPPFLSAPMEAIKNEDVKHLIRIARSVVKAGFTSLVDGLHQNPKTDNTFAVLSNWIPHLFVNKRDPICSEYIGYFEQRKIMEQIGAGEIERIATQTSCRSILSRVMGIDREPLHLIPSAYLHINHCEHQNFNQEHRIHQWWNPNIDVQVNLHKFS